MSGNTTDVIVIGGGTGGYSTALRAAHLGLGVTLVERDLVGGTCLHRGCVPSKAMLHAAELVDGVAEARERWGVKATLDSVDWSALVATRDDIVSRNHKGVEGQLSAAGVTVVRGTATLAGPRTVQVDVPGAGGGRWTARRGLVLATGSRPRTLPGLEPTGEHIVTSDDALFAPGLPSSVLVLGGGAIGVEYASFHRSMGAEVTLVEAAERLLPLEDEDVSRHLTRALKKRGITVLTGARLTDARRTGTHRTSAGQSGTGIRTGTGQSGAGVRTGTEQSGAGIEARVQPARGGETVIAAERLLVAVGRVPVTDGLNLAAAGLATDERGFVPPADWATLETAVPGVFVVGDLLPPPSLGLAHASFAEGLVVAETLAGLRPRPVDYAAVPRVTYSSPQTASVGLGEAAARDAGFEVVSNVLPLTATAKGMVHGQGGMVKVVAEPGPDGRVLGVHLVGPHVSEMISESQLAVAWDASPADIAQHIHAHPTLSEAVGETFLTLAGRGLHQHA
ncbi:dihydrolipoyl dehydrogenase [Streptomyces sp. CA-250714]|uniref:dihydrolipoyl dehydrogenase n=1 Tax=Streptomyces sp. CA-250714 TaxID=3240060 RepID=UPI003D8DDBFE